MAEVYSVDTLVLYLRRWFMVDGASSLGAS